MQSFECFDMLMIAFAHYILCCVDLMNAKIGSKNRGYFLLMKGWFHVLNLWFGLLEWQMMNFEA